MIFDIVDCEGLEARNLQNPAKIIDSIIYDNNYSTSFGKHEISQIGINLFRKMTLKFGHFARSMNQVKELDTANPLRPTRKSLSFVKSTNLHTFFINCALNIAN